MLEDVKAEKVLDASCGTGIYALELAERGMRVTAVDLSDQMLEIASHKAESRGLPITFRKADVKKLPFPDQAFDLVLSILGLEFMDAKVEAIRELLRVTRESGYLILGVLNKHSLWTLKRKIKALFADTLWRKAKFLSESEWKRLLKKIEGYRFVAMKRAIYYPPIENPTAAKTHQILEIISGTLFPLFPTFIAFKVQKIAAASKNC
ncbi:MAG: Malonyl-(acyl-carrier protein) O-methyltransferase [candidate division WS2 bacterium]|nr:Malonyl-(acyl-carrier protein) O-methyltransferase [Candidatus Lithacetigena glycinireducens]